MASSLGDIDLDLYDTTLLTVPPPVKDDIFGDLFGSAACGPSLETGIAPRVITFATRCVMCPRSRSELREPRLTEVKIEASAADAYRYSRTVAGFSPFMSNSGVTKEFATLGHGVYENGYASREGQ